MKETKKIFYPHWHEKNHLMYNCVEKANEEKKEADKMKKYEEIIVKEICNECNFAERIIVKLFKRLIFKIYHLSREYTINSIEK